MEVVAWLLHITYLLLGNGIYQCGACVCDAGFIGLDCSCDEQNVESLEEYIKNCTDPNRGKVCNEVGACRCGKCICE